MTPPLPLDGYQHLCSGKVRDLYAPLDRATGQPHSDVLLLVASDRISAYDHVLRPAIPDKGAVLTQLSLWWFEQLADLVPNHVLDLDVPSPVAGRAVLVRRLRMVPVECVARSYLTGSGLAEYRERGSVCGQPLPRGLTEASKLPEVVFTPTTKAPTGQHDEAMTYPQVQELVGEDQAAALRELTCRVLARGNEIASRRGILIADTKVEFGIDPRASADSLDLVLADEVLTPDSSRFWPAAQWQPGRPQRSFDKQVVRDWLTSPASGWDRHGSQAPPELPADVVAATRDTYLAAFEALTGRRWG